MHFCDRNFYSEQFSWSNLQRFVTKLFNWNLKLESKAVQLDDVFFYQNTPVKTCKTVVPYKNCFFWSILDYYYYYYFRYYRKILLFLLLSVISFGNILCYSVNLIWITVNNWSVFTTLLLHKQKFILNLVKLNQIWFFFFDRFVTKRDRLDSKSIEDG